MARANAHPAGLASFSILEMPDVLVMQLIRSKL